MSLPSLFSRSRLPRFIGELLALTLITTLLWAFLYGKTTVEAWKIPTSYAGDATLSMSVAKGYAEAGLPSVFDKEIPRLDAPYIANWNEWPITEDGLVYLQGYLGKAFGIGVAANLIFLLGQILAVLSFYFVCRLLSYRRSISASLALLYGFSYFIFSRGYGQITLTYCWHLPLCFLVTWWAASVKRFQWQSPRFALSLIISFLCGSQNPYYTFLYLQLLGWAALSLALRRQWKNLLFPAANIAIVLFAFTLGNLDSFVNDFRHGPNIGAVVRGFTGLEIYALKPIELLLIPPGHHIALWGWFWKSHQIGEDSSVYLGIIGIIGLLSIGWFGFKAALSGQRDKSPLPVHFWQALWIIAFATVDGVNALLGTFGFQIFRGTNRYSVILLALSLLFLARQLTRHCPRRLLWAAALLILLIGLWDQTPREFPLHNTAAIAENLTIEKNFTAEMESKLPPGAMVFDLPVADFPEQGTIHQMIDYAEFGPYLFSKTLRFSYGGTKGRSREEWQSSITKLPPAALIAHLEQYGFSTIFIDGNGYEDGGVALIAGLKAAGAKPLVGPAENRWTALQIAPSPTPVLPPSPPRPEKGFYPMIDLWRETGTAWAKGTGDLALYNPFPQSKEAVLHLTVFAPGRGTIKIGGKTTLIEPGIPVQLAPKLTLPSGESTLTIESTLPRLNIEGDDTPSSYSPGPYAYLIRNVALAFPQK